VVPADTYPAARRRPAMYCFSRSMTVARVVPASRYGALVLRGRRQKLIFIVGRCDLSLKGLPEVIGNVRARFIPP
jgi:hypothetical protein